MKLNCRLSVPTAPLTVTAVRTPDPPNACGAHTTAVADVHAELMHVSDTTIETEAVKSAPAKPRPPIVTVPPPLCAEFRAPGTLAAGAAHDTNHATKRRREVEAGHRRM